VRVSISHRRRAVVSSSDRLAAVMRITLVIGIKPKCPPAASSSQLRSITIGMRRSAVVDSCTRDRLADSA
jgi:hypothetical protein